MTPLERDCYRVIAYFDVFRYPVTAFEVWKWLYAPAEPWSLAQVMTCLTTSAELQSRVQMHGGFYGLSSVVAACADRHTRYLDALRKYARVQRVLQYMGRLPYIAGIAVCNSLAYHHTSAESDIDLFIITAPRRVWTVRLLAVSAMALLRLRPGEATRDPVCCSFFADQDVLSLEVLKHAADDPYLAMWHTSLIPLVEHDNVFSALRAHNAWATTTVPHALPVRRAPAYRLGRLRPLRWLPLTERLARSFQEMRLSPAIAQLKNRDTRVVINNKMLKFHENDRREAIATSLAERMANI